MKFTYACKKVSLNDSIKDYAEKRISKLQRYFHDEDTSASVTFSVDSADALWYITLEVTDDHMGNNSAFTAVYANTAESANKTTATIKCTIQFIKWNIILY